MDRNPSICAMVANTAADDESQLKPLRTLRDVCRVWMTIRKAQHSEPNALWSCMRDAT